MALEICENFRAGELPSLKTAGGIYTCEGEALTNFFSGPPWIWWLQSAKRREHCLGGHVGLRVAL